MSSLAVNLATFVIADSDPSRTAQQGTRVWCTFSHSVRNIVLTTDRRLPNWTSTKMYAWLANAYVEDIELNKKFDVYDGTMEDAILVYGSVNDCQLLEPYYAPVIVPRISRQIQGTANITKLLIVPGAADPSLKISPSDQLNCTSALCLQHAAARRRAKSGRPSVSLAASESLTALKNDDSVTVVKFPGENEAQPAPMPPVTT